MIFGRLGEPGGGDRAGDEAQPDRVEPGWRQARRGIARPEAVAVARDGDEARHLVVADQVVDFRALGERPAEIAAAEGAEILPRPRRLASDPAGRFCGSVRMSSVPLVAPQIFQVAVDRGQPLLEPRFLLAAEHGVGGLVLAEIGRSSCRRW